MNASFIGSYISSILYVHQRPFCSMSTTQLTSLIHFLFLTLTRPLCSVSKRQLTLFYIKFKLTAYR